MIKVFVAFVCFPYIIMTRTVYLATGFRPRPKSDRATLFGRGRVESVQVKKLFSF